MVILFKQTFNQYIIKAYMVILFKQTFNQYIIKALYGHLIQANIQSIHY